MGATHLHDCIQIRAVGAEQAPMDWILLLELHSSAPGSGSTRRNSLMERLYADGGTLWPPTTNLQAVDTLQTINRYEFKAPAS